MSTGSRLGLAACLPLLLVSPGRADEKIDTTHIAVKRAIADTMTPEQLQAYKERLARNIANRRRARTAAPGLEVPADTCPAATLEVASLAAPFLPIPGTTVGAADNYALPPANAAPTCTAPTSCTGDGVPASLPRGSIYTGTGVGPDRAYHLKTDSSCDLTIVMDPTDTGAAADDLALIVYQSTCSNLLSDCVCVDDTDVGGGAESVVLNAVANTDYFVVVDGYSTGGAPPADAGPFQLSITRTSGTCNLVSAGVYYTVTPCRVIDTRGAAGAYGGPALSAGIDRSFDIDAAACNVPAAATAVFLSLTVVNPSATGNVRLWPTGAASPTVSALNYSAGQTRGNNGIFKLSATGSLDVRATQASGTVDLIVDVAGYFIE